MPLATTDGDKIKTQIERQSLTMKKLARILTTGLAAATLAIGAAAAIQPAQEAQAAPGCSAGEGCFYGGANFVDGPKKFRECINDFRRDHFNDWATSVFNAGKSDTLYGFIDANGRGAYWTFFRGVEYKRLSTGADNKLSSGYFASLLDKKGQARCN